MVFKEYIYIAIKVDYEENQKKSLGERNQFWNYIHEVGACEGEYCYII